MKIPVAVVCGKNNSFLKWEPQKEQIINDASILKENIHILEAKHFIQEENPKEISKIALNFMI